MGPYSRLQPREFLEEAIVKLPESIFLRVISAGVVLFLMVNGYAKNQVKRTVTPGSKLFLQQGWTIQSSALIKEKGEALSKNTFQPTVKWYEATVPSTVLGTLVENKIYPEPFFGTNLRLIPGCQYPIGANFSNLPMPEGSPFHNSWWYRTQFRLPIGYRWPVLAD